MKNVKLALLICSLVFSTNALANKHHKHYHTRKHLHIATKLNNKSPFFSRVVFIKSVDEQNIVFQKNVEKPSSIASITKLMVATIIAENNLPMDDQIQLTEEDAVASSRLKVGEKYTRGQLLNVALMSSDNRAAHALARTYPGGLTVAINTMNETATKLGMNETLYIEPTGLDARNHSTAADLTKLMNYAKQFPVITQYASMAKNEISDKVFYNTNAYIRSGEWTNIVLSKTGYTQAAGKCMVVVMNIREKLYDIVILGASSSKQRLKDLATAKKMIEKEVS
jgi:D-alanyl-D-alanine endopeptidase (penicillin-binding protein 7)